MSELLGIGRFKFHEGKREEYLRLSDQAMDIVRTKDSGTLQYDTYLNDDRSEVMIIERYRDSEAAMEHAANLGHLFAATGAARGDRTLESVLDSPGYQLSAAPFEAVSASWFSPARPDPRARSASRSWSALHTRSGVNGASRRRMPAARWTALAIAAAT